MGSIGEHTKISSAEGFEEGINFPFCRREALECPLRARGLHYRLGIVQNYRQRRCQHCKAKIQNI